VKRHILLIGLPGAGKTVVGQVAARILGCAFCDLDDRVTEAAGVTVAQLFAERGEAAFRAAEREAAEAALDEPPQVLAAGGGWAAQPGNLERAGDRALTVHLVCAPETAARRLAGTQNRPLLAGDLLGRLRRLAAERQAYYERADAGVVTDGRTVEEVAADVAVLARSAGGW